jgi:uncharacterized protein (TIGR03382 family)
MRSRSTPVSSPVSFPVSCRVSLVSVLVATALLVVPSLADASSSFPPAIQSHLGAPTPIPACIVCHDTASGGSGTANRVFALSTKKNGLLSADVNSLNKSLDALAAAKTDSDSDGMSDIDELKAGRDPSVPECDGGSQCGSVSKIVYGCSSTSDAPTTAGAAMLALVALALVRRRRAR